MWFCFDECELRNNPNVYKVNAHQLVLRISFRIRIYKLWRDDRLDEINDEMEINGLGPNQTGESFLDGLFTAFKLGGYPIPRRGEKLVATEVVSENPLVASGVFVWLEKKHGLRLSKDADKKLFSTYPEISVEDGLRLAGVDPVDVGYQRIKNIERDFEQRAQSVYGGFKYNSEEGLSLTQGEHYEVCDKKKLADLMRHPYVREVSGSCVKLMDSFYNEAYFLAEVGMEKLLELYELPREFFDERSIMVIQSKLLRWQPSEIISDDISIQQLRIWHGRVLLMENRVKDNLCWIKKMLPDMGIESKRKLAFWIDSLPRDPWRKYTIRRILEIIGLSKSTYYELLRNENFGTGAMRRAMRDDEDIILVQQVAEYKGYKKGYRQISMMMEDVTGRIMSAHRVLYLMRKYGMRTNIRKPSKNRKAMKALMERNGKPNLLMRKFKLYRPNEVRLTDVTYLDYGRKKRAYGSASIDPVTGKLICFVVSENNDLQLALDTLEAMDTYPIKSGGIIHSDQGILYFTDDFQNVVKEKNLEQSMSRRGNCWDNAPQESFFGHFKDECDYKKCKNINELKATIDDYSVYYNEMRRLWNHGRMTPQEYETYLDGLDEEAFKEYIEKEEARYLKKKEQATQAAVDKAKERKKAIKERLEEIENETGGK